MLVKSVSNTRFQNEAQFVIKIISNSMKMEEMLEKCIFANTKKVKIFSVIWPSQSVFFESGAMEQFGFVIWLRSVLHHFQQNWLLNVNFR